MRRAALFLWSFIYMSAGLSGAEFWETKSLAEWSDKDIQKLVTNSPWARQTKGVADGATESTPFDTASGIPQAGLGRASEGLGASGPGASNTPAPFDSATRAAAVIPEVSVTVRWLSALPMRQAQMRAKYGKEADASPAAKQYLETEPVYYTIGVSGVPGLYLSAYGGDRAKELIQKFTTLTLKGREPLRPVAVQFVPNGPNIDVLIAFPRSGAITLADQDVDFSGRLGTLGVHYRFRLKDMVARGKLEL